MKSTKPKNSVNDAKEVYSLVEQRFIELWGDMSSWWGVSRTMAEIHGLLFIPARPTQPKIFKTALASAVAM